MYNQTGSYVAVAGLIVMVLNYFKIHIVQTDVESVIGALVTIYGVGHQYFAHKALAVSAGAISPK